jgi:hypothetical protein
VDFEIIDEIPDIETIAVNTSIHDLDRLRKVCGKGRWRKLKGGAALAQFVSQRVRLARPSLCANIGETPDHSIISEQGGKEDNLCW